MQGEVSVKAVQDFLGHSNIKTTMRYAHINTETLRESIKVLEGNNNLIINRGHNLTIYKRKKIFTIK